MQAKSSSAFLRMLGHSHGDPQGGLEGSDIRDSFPGDIMGGPVGRGGDHDGMASGNGYASIESQQLGGDLPLVVIHGHDAGKLAPAGAHKDRIRGVGTDHVHPFRPGLFHRGFDDRVFFRTEETLLPPVGIKRGHPDFWVF